MVFNSKIIALIIAILITCITIVIDWFFDLTGVTQYAIVYGATFLSSFFLVFVTIDALIFTEINKLYRILDRIKQKEDKIHFKDFKTKNLPIKRKKIVQEVYTYVTRKQAEINELKKLEVFRREFLADISHELKTPIFAAQGFIHTLLDGAMNDKEVKDKFLKKAAKSLDGLQELVEELLMLSKLETGELQMIIQDFDIHALVKDVFEMLESKAKKKDIQMKFADYCDFPIFVKGDEYQIKQVIRNLVVNAVNYGNDKGKVVVAFDQEKDNVIISVKDDGPGIPPEHLKRVFERFYRVEKSRSKDKGGSGLGLAIVQEIVEAHHSKVMVTSKVGKGSTFAFILKRGYNDKIQGFN